MNFHKKLDKISCVTNCNNLYIVATSAKDLVEPCDVNADV